MSDFKASDKPWPKVRFTSGDGHIYEGFVCGSGTDNAGTWLYVSQNQTWETVGKAQNWVIRKKQVVTFYNETYILNSYEQEIYRI